MAGPASSVIFSTPTTSTIRAPAAAIARRPWWTAAEPVAQAFSTRVAGLKRRAGSAWSTSELVKSCGDEAAVEVAEPDLVDLGRARARHRRWRAVRGLDDQALGVCGPRACRTADGSSRRCRRSWASAPRGQWCHANGTALARQARSKLGGCRRAAASSGLCPRHADPADRRLRPVHGEPRLDGARDLAAGDRRIVSARARSGSASRSPLSVQPRRVHPDQRLGRRPLSGRKHVFRGAIVVFLRRLDPVRAQRLAAGSWWRRACCRAWAGR